MMTDASAGKKVFLGRVGENEARVVRFSVGKMLAAFPGATFTVLNRRPCDAAAYPVNDQYVSLAGDTVLWTIQSGDVTVAGTGECEIRAEKDGKILKSQIYMTETGRALDGSGTPPQPWESWVQQVKDDADRAEEAASKIIPIKDTVTDNSIANVPDACEGAVDALVLKLNPIQEGSGDPSPSNVREISGRSAAVVHRSGINVWDEEFEVGGIDTTTGENVSGNSTGRSKNYISIVPNTSYYRLASGCADNGVFITYFYDINKNFLSYTGSSNTNPSTFTTPATAYYMRFVTKAVYGTTYNHDISINYPSTDTEYHAYNADEHTAQLPVTVYGGEVDWKQGKLKVTHGIVDLGSLDWTYQTHAFNFRSTTALENAKLPSGATKLPSAICSCYPIVSYEYLSTHTDCATIIFSSSGLAGQVWLNDSTYTDPDDFKTAMSGMTICYELATPVEYDLAALPEDIQLVFGENNIWIDNGKIKSMTYPCDTKLYIDKKVSALQALILEH